MIMGNFILALNVRLKRNLKFDLMLVTYEQAMASLDRPFEFVCANIVTKIFCV